MSLEKKLQFLSIGTTRRMESNYYYYMLGQNSKIINYVLLCSETLRVKLRASTFIHS